MVSKIQNIRSASLSFVTIYACDRQADERTGEHNYDSHDSAIINVRAVKTTVALERAKDRSVIAAEI